MGFSGMAALTHEMEDVFELLRQRTGGLERVAIDVLLRVPGRAVGRRRVDRRRPAPRRSSRSALIESLRGLVRERTPEQEAERAGVAAAARRPLRAGRRPPRDPDLRAPRRRRLDAGRARLHGALGDRRLRRDARLRARRRTTSTPSTAATSTPGSSPSAPTPRSRTPSRSVPEVAEVHVFEAVADAALDAPDEVEEAVTAPAADVAASSPTCPPASRPPRPSRRRRAAGRSAPQPTSKQHGGSSTVRVDAERLDQLMHFMGELVLHRTQVEALIAAGRRARPLAGHAEPHAHLARAAVDGHAGPDDPGGGRLPALPAARARPLDQARQAGRPAARGQGHRARPHRGRRARRSARAPRPQLARPRPRGRRRSASRRASRPPARSRSPPSTPAAT